MLKWQLFHKIFLAAFAQENYPWYDPERSRRVFNCSKYSCESASCILMITGASVAREGGVPTLCESKKNETASRHCWSRQEMLGISKHRRHSCKATHQELKEQRDAIKPEMRVAQQPHLPGPGPSMRVLTRGRTYFCSETCWNTWIGAQKSPYLVIITISKPLLHVLTNFKKSLVSSTEVNDS